MLVVTMTLGVWYLFYPTVRSHFKLIQGDSNNFGEATAIMEHQYKALFDFGYKFKFFSPPYFSPSQNTALFTDLYLGVSPVFWALRAVFDPFTSYQVWSIIMYLLIFLSAHLLLRALKVPGFLSLFSALIFVFVNNVSMVLFHAEMLSVWYSILFLYFLVRLMQKQSVVAFALAIVCLLLQLFSNFSLGITLAVCAFFIALFLVVDFRNGLVRIIVLHRASFLLGIAALILTAAAVWRFYLGQLFVLFPLTDFIKLLPLPRKEFLLVILPIILFRNSKKTEVRLCLYLLLIFSAQIYLEIAQSGKVLFELFLFVSVVALFSAVYTEFNVRFYKVAIAFLLVGTVLALTGGKPIYPYQYTNRKSEIYARPLALIMFLQNYDCKLFYIQASGHEQLMLKEIHLAGVWGALESGIPTLNGIGKYTPYPFEKGLPLGAAALVHKENGVNKTCVLDVTPLRYNHYHLVRAFSD